MINSHALLRVGYSTENKVSFSTIFPAHKTIKKHISLQFNYLLLISSDTNQKTSMPFLYNNTFVKKNNNVITNKAGYLIVPIMPI